MFTMYSTKRFKKPIKTGFLAEEQQATRYFRSTDVFPIICFQQINPGAAASILEFGTRQPAVLKHSHELMLLYCIIIPSP